MIIQKKTAGSIVLKCEALLQLPEHVQLERPHLPNKKKEKGSWNLKSAIPKSSIPHYFLWGSSNVTPAQVKATRGATACCDAGCKHAVWSLCHHCAWIYPLVPYCFQLTCCSHCLCLFQTVDIWTSNVTDWITKPYYGVSNYERCTEVYSYL